MIRLHNSRLLCLVVLLLARRTQSVDDTVHRPIEILSHNDGMALLVNEDNVYGIFYAHVTFTQANVVCLSRHGTLMEYNTTGQAEFMAKALSESDIGNSSAWIGAKYYPEMLTKVEKDANGVDIQLSKPAAVPAHWEWLSGTMIANGTTYRKWDKFPYKKLPFWSERPDFTLTTEQCLVMLRDPDQKPMVRGESCSGTRPFVCSLPGRGYDTATVEVLPPVSVDGKVFHIFQSQQSWSESADYCMRNGHHLARITKQTEIDDLQERMERVKPRMNQAWIGGFLKGNDTWTWIYTNMPLDSNFTHKVNEGQWPAVASGKNCLLADINTRHSFTFVADNCNQKKCFICEAVADPLPAENNGQVVELIHVPNSQYWVSTMDRTWEEAQRMCGLCLKKGTLFEPVNLDRTDEFINRAMVELSDPDIRYIWVNGKLNGDKFQWQTEYSKNKSISDGKYLWDYTGDFDEDPGLVDFECLNLERLNENEMYLYGVFCNHSQHYMCTEWDQTNTGAYQSADCKL